MYNNKENNDSNEINTANEDIIFDERVMCKTNEDSRYKSSEQDLEESILDNNYKTPLVYIQLVICLLFILIILSNKYIVKSQNLNDIVVNQITHETTEEEIQDFINSILDIKNR